MSLNFVDFFYLNYYYQIITYLINEIKSDIKLSRKPQIIKKQIEFMSSNQKFRKLEMINTLTFNLIFI